MQEKSRNLSRQQGEESMVWDKMSCTNGCMVKSSLVISLVPYNLYCPYGSGIFFKIHLFLIFSNQTFLFETLIFWGALHWVTVHYTLHLGIKLWSFSNDTEGLRWKVCLPLIKAFIARVNIPGCFQLTEQSIKRVLQIVQPKANITKLGLWK